MLNNKQFKLLLEDIQSKKEIEVLLKKYDIINYIINDDNSIDVNDKVWLKDKELTKLPFKFNKIKRGFYCHFNNLTSLEGVPKIVGEDFHCSENQLTSLKGAPQEVGGEFDCHSNKLTSLKGAPQKIGGEFDCYNNRLTNLIGAPQEVKGNFNCMSNQLTSLEGGPKIVKGKFVCDDNQLISLDGAPEILEGEFFLISEDEWEHLNPFKEQEQEVTLDDITDTYGGRIIDVKKFLYKNNRLIKR
jgi:hypothetical protein